MKQTTIFPLLVLIFALGGAVIARSVSDPPRHDSRPSASGQLVVTLCDGETATEIPGVREGETPTPEQARAAADDLMTEWRRKHPEARWEDAALQLAQGEKAPAETPGKAPLPSKPEGELQSGHTYGAFGERDERIWQAETERFVQEGHRVFHDAKAFGGTIGVSCDMCHPDAANTHPETYPKFQVQLGRVALLRDMINWCIQNPSRGKPLADDDPRLKAMEAYILAQRKGAALEFGKH
jgi:hypothetical protein